MLKEDKVITADLGSGFHSLEAVAKVSAAAASILDADELLQTTADLVKANFKLYHAHVYLLDEAGESLVLAAGAGEVGRAMKKRGHQIPLNHEHSLVALAAQTRQPVVVNDVSRDANFLANPLLPQTRAEMATPMLARGTLVGVLDIQDNALDRFSEDDARVQTILAEQIAVAVQNARAFAETQSARHQAQLVALTNERLSQSKTELDILKPLFDVAPKANLNHVLLTSITLDAQHQPEGVNILAGIKADGNPVDLASTFPLAYLSIENFPFLSVIFAHPDLPVLMDNLATDPRTDTPVLRAFIAKSGSKSTILLPLRTGSEWQGMAVISYSQPQVFPEELGNIYLQAMPTAASILSALNALSQEKIALEEAEFRSRDLSTVAEVSTSISTILDIDTLLQTVCDLTKANFHLYHAHVYLVDETGEDLVLAAGAGEAGRRMKAEGRRIAISNQGSLVARAARTRKGALANDVTLAPDFLPNPYLPDTRSEAAIPLLVGDQLVGVLDVQSTKVGRFTDNDIRVKISLGAQIAVAVQNARAFEQRRVLQQETELLYGVSSRLSGAKSRQDLLAAVSDYSFNKGGTGALLAYIDLDDNGAPEWVELVAEITTTKQGLPIGTRIKLADVGVARLWVSSPEMALLIPNTQDADKIDKTSRDLFAQNGQMAAVIMPLYLQERWVGLVVSQWDKTQQFTEQDQRIYTAMGSQLAAVVDAVRSNEALEAAKYETELLYDVANRLSGAKTRDELLAAVSDYAINKGGTGASLMYIDLDKHGDPEWLELVAQIETSGKSFPVGTRFKLADFAIARTWIASPEASLLIPNTQDENTVDAPTRQVFAQIGQMASAIMPLYLQGRWVGLAQCQWNQPQQFTEQDRRIYDALGRQLAAVVDAVRSSEALAAAKQETDLLYDVSRRLAGAKTRQDLLNAVSDYSLTQGGNGASLLYIDLDENGVPEWVELVAEITITGHGFPVGTRFKLADFAIARMWIASPETPLLIGDTQDEKAVDAPTREVFRQAGQLATVIMPLYLQGRWVGLGLCQWDKPRQFTEQDQRIYTAMGSQLAAVVDAVRSNEALAKSQQETEQRANELETVAEVSTTAASVLDIDALLQTVVDLTKSRFDLYHAHIYLYDDAGKRLILSAGAGDAGHRMKAEGRSIALDNLGSLVARAGRSRGGVIENDVTKAPDFLPNPYLPDTRAELAIPMIVASKLVGVLDIQSELANRFAQSDVSIMTTLAGQIAVAVQNARSYQQQVELVGQLQTVDRLKSEFLASMSHELRTPLNSIIGYSRMLLDGADGELDEEMNEDMEAIHNSGQHLLHLINDILDLAKIEAQRLEIDQEEVTFSLISEEVTRMTSVLLQAKPVEMVQDIDPQLPLLWADPIRLRQVLNNLVSNAIKFTEKGEIRITARMDNKMAVIGVHDTGMGISPDQLERVFERFHQADTSSTRKAGGTGLGLTISRHLVEMHGGKIWADSTLGKGTTFWFSMPTVAA